MPINTTLLRDEVIWKIFRSIRDSVGGHRLTKHEVRERVLSTLAKEYNVDVADITPQNENTLYTVQSKLMRLLFPVTHRAKANLDLALSGEVSFKHALLIARGRFDTKEEILASPSPHTQVIKINSIPLTDFFAAIISTASANGYDAEDIQNAFNDAFDAYDTDNT